ncbi:DsbA family protein [Methanobrevibacter sp.]|uniref:DsbA family oxidoreductase n=1 Tax=Methanobrevibacter sp. TaxID=66852 RepID=UPI0038647128
MRIIYLIDFNCPYSYIGLKRLKKAVENLGLDVEWEMKSFELEPQAGKRPVMSTTERYVEKYGLSHEDAEAKIAEIEKTAFNDGLEINYRDMLLVSSKDALRLAKYAQNMHPEIALKLVEEIFEANLVRNENIKKNDVLTGIAVSCGIDESDAKKIIENNYYNIEAYLDQEDALSNGITATPYFILELNESRLNIPGVFSSEEFETALKDFESGDIEDKTFL